MPDEVTGQEPTADSPEQSPAPEQAQDDKMFPASYVSELRQEAAEYRTKLREKEQALQEREKEELAEQEKWRELAEQHEQRVKELEPVQERYETMLQRLQDSNQQRIDALPEDMRTLVPEYDDPSKLAAWLDANADKLKKPTAPKLNGGAGGGERPGSKVTLNDQQRAMARRLGVTEEEYAEQLA